jgi:hypothetical protein
MKLRSATHSRIVIAALVSLLPSFFLPVACAPPPTAGVDSSSPRWFKGNLHTHSLWSDGDDFPEMIADWYKQHGYHFLAISDHNVLQEGQHWLELGTVKASNPGSNSQRNQTAEALEKYVQRFGTAWVERRTVGEKDEIRLKPLNEYRFLLEEPGRFLMIPSAELTLNASQPQSDRGREHTVPVHLNATNLRDFIPPLPGSNTVDTMQKNVDAVLAQRLRTGQPMFPHINHPNFHWAISAEELMQLRGERFFEVYNGHPAVNNAGDPAHLNMDAMWDAVLTRRLGELGLEAMFAVAADDAHHYRSFGPRFSNSGRGWVMVRARHLTPELIVLAMEAGDFYATTGVMLREVYRTDRRLAVEIASEPGVRYVTQFIGTRRGYDPRSEVISPSGNNPIERARPAHRRYSKDVGAVLAEVAGPNASYLLQGDELYVRAKIVSSKPKANGSAPGEFETAWTQPLVNPIK